MANNADGRIVLFGHGATPAKSQLHSAEQKQVRALKPSDWTSWQDLSRYGTGTVASVTVQLDTEGALNVFGLNDGAQVIHTRQFPPGSRKWMPWAAPGLISEELHGVASGIDGDGHIVLVAQGKSQYLYGNQQLNVEYGRWNNWQRIFYFRWPRQPAARLQRQRPLDRVRAGAGRSAAAPVPESG